MSFYLDDDLCRSHGIHQTVDTSVTHYLIIMQGSWSIVEKILTQIISGTELLNPATEMKFYFYSIHFQNPSFGFEPASDRGPNPVMMPPGEHEYVNPVVDIRSKVI